MGGVQASEYEEDMSISGNLREVFHGGFSDDESVLSGPLSDDGREALLADDAVSHRGGPPGVRGGGF
jgi:hypothetical protein